MDIAGVQVGLFDIIALGVLIFFMILGLMKGFAFQVIRLITFVVALLLAKNFAGSADIPTTPLEEDAARSSVSFYLIEWFPNQFEGNREIAVYVAYFLIFVTVFILGTLLGFLLRALLKRLELRSYDRILGGVLGTVVGAVCIVVVVSLFISGIPNAELTQKISESYAFNMSIHVIRIAEPFFPKELLAKIDDSTYYPP
ncbi:MAG: CvpA family protein, partial [Planctomycetota bacterium]